MPLLNPLAIAELSRQANGPFTPTTTAPEPWSPFTPTTTAPSPGPVMGPPSPSPASPVPSGGSGRGGSFDALVGQSVGSGKTTITNRPNAPATSAPMSVNDVPQVNRDDFGKRTLDWSDPRQVMFNLSQTVSPSGPAMSDASDYTDAKLARLDQIAGLAGLTEDQRRAVAEQVRFQVGQAGDDPTAVMDAVDAATAELEATLAQQAISTPAEGEAAAAAPGQWTPEQMMAAQTLAGNFMRPFAEQTAANGAMQAAALNELAKTLPPEMAKLATAQAATRAAGQSRLAEAYMQQAMMTPGIAAYQQAGAMQGQIDNLTRQVMAQQSGGSTDQLTPDLLAAALGQ